DTHPLSLHDALPIYLAHIRTEEAGKRIRRRPVDRHGKPRQQALHGLSLPGAQALAFATSEEGAGLRPVRSHRDGFSPLPWPVSRSEEHTSELQSREK